MKSIYFIGLSLLLSACGGNPEAAAPIALQPGDYEIVQTGGPFNFQPRHYCLKSWNLDKGPHEMTEQLITMSGEYPEDCSATPGERKGNALSTTHLCLESGSNTDTLDTEYRFKTVITWECLTFDRTTASTLRSGASDEAVADQKTWNAEYDKAGPITFSATRKGEC